MSSPSAAASAGTSAGGTRVPDTPSATSSRTPPETSKLTHGTPQAAASASAIGRPSRSLLIATTDSSRYAAAMSCAVPRKTTWSATPRSSARIRSSPSSGPSPKRCSSQPSRPLWASAKASIIRSYRLIGSSRPTAPILRVSSGASSSGKNGSGFGMTRTFGTRWFTNSTASPSESTRVCSSSG